MSASMRVELLGTMRVLIDGEPLPKMRSQKAKWLLALLALRNGKPVGRSVVAATLWPSSETAGALTNLRSVISDLRQALGDQAGRLRTPDRRTLSFDFQGVEIDVLAFDAAIEAKDWDAAVALYTGPLLQDCDEEWAAQERSGRERTCLAACHELMQEGNPPKAIAVGRRAVELAPRQDGPRRDLMTAYARANDVNAALAVYRDFAQVLRAESGDLPDAETTDLFLSLRAGSTPDSPISGGLPHAYSSFVGREEERAEVADAIRSNRLVTLTGIGGIGKTRLACEAALAARADSPNGVSFVPLEAVHGEETLVQAVVSTLRIKLSPEIPPLRGLLDTLKTKRFLLILDNCEHLVATCARLVNRLLAECPGLRVLATSREPLSLVGEMVLPLSGLTDHESVRLFVERSQTMAKRFELTNDNSPAVAELCTLLEGSPLAIELAAGRVRTMGVPDILARFRDHRLDFLAGRRQVRAPRHQTLRATLDWSFSLLGPEERRLFARLSVFADGWTMEAAEAVVDATPDLLESLVEKSLVVFSDGRYSLLETVRQYADERLSTSREQDRLRERHVAYYTELAGRLKESQATHEAYERERGNFNAVMDRPDTDPAMVLDLTKALLTYWMDTYAVFEGARRIEDALQKFDPSPSSRRAHAVRNLSILYNHVDRQKAISLTEENLQIWRQLNDRPGTIRTLCSLGLHALFLGDTRRAQHQLEESIAIAREVVSMPGVPYMLACSLNSLAMVYAETGAYPRAKEALSEGLALTREHARPLDIAPVLRVQGFLAHELSDYAAYRRLNEEALSIYRSHGNDDGAAWCLVDVGNAATELALIEEGLAMLDRLGDRVGTNRAIEILGASHVALDDVERGRRLLLDSLDGYRMLGHPIGIARALDGLGDASRQVGAPDANTHYRDGLTIWQAAGAQRRVRDGLLRIGDGLSDRDRAIRLWACAYRFGEMLGAPIPPRLRVLHERVIRPARTEPGFETTWAVGWEMSLQAAVDLALTP